jgi:isoaspartyl peptidase/L-asparaginase-like protein (Ntn-hydrolase superfamily)
MRTCVSFCIVENIRRGMNVQEACVEGLRRIKALKPKRHNLATMHPKLVVGVIAMDKFGNVSVYLFFGCFSLTFGFPI